MTAIKAAPATKKAVVRYRFTDARTPTMAFLIATICSRRIAVFFILIFQWLRNRAALILRHHNEFYEPERFRRAGIPMGMNRACRDEQAISSVQCDRRLAVLLPNTGPG